MQGARHLGSPWQLVSRCYRAHQRGLLSAPPGLAHRRESARCAQVDLGKQPGSHKTPLLGHTGRQGEMGTKGNEERARTYRSGRMTSPGVNGTDKCTHAVSTRQDVHPSLRLRRTSELLKQHSARGRSGETPARALWRRQQSPGSREGRLETSAQGHSKPLNRLDSCPRGISLGLTYKSPQKTILTTYNGNVSEQNKHFTGERNHVSQGLGSSGLLTISERKQNLVSSVLD